jgi:hypothetical protein
MTSIQDLTEKIKGLADFKAPNLRALPDDLFLGLIIVLVAFGSFGLGRLSKIQGTKTPIRIENQPEITADTFSAKSAVDTPVTPPALDGAQSGGDLVGSKNGTKYYYPWCTGVSKISPANIVHFATAGIAESQGLASGGSPGPPSLIRQKR